MNIIIKLLLSGISVFLTAWLLPGVALEGFGIALIVAIILGLLNAIVKPILVLLTLPVTILTLGLFLLVINGLIIMMCDGLIGGFSVENFWWALLFSIIMTIVNSILEGLAKDG